jgi:quercetin dioxygenase-like cupin family protein
MNLNDLHPDKDKQVATRRIYNENGMITLLSIQKEATLKEHQSKTNAMLILMSGHVIYEEESRKVELSISHDFVNIPQKVTHKVSASEDSFLMLIQ